jgi:uncharacterized membrane protein HdeD (DUF308 family)
MLTALIALTANETSLLVAGIISLVTGVVILLFPQVLAYIVAIYLLLVGIAMIGAAI